MQPVNESDLDWTESNGDAGFRRKQLAESAPGGGEDLGCSLYELDAGESAWPYHYHAGNAEAMYVLDGAGAVRCPDGDSDTDGPDGDAETADDTNVVTHDVESGDYLAFPANPDGAHQVVNDSDEPLRYLVFSTMNDPDVTRYVEADAIGVYEGSAPGAHGDREYTGYFQETDAVDYWEDIDGRGRVEEEERF